MSLWHMENASLAMPSEGGDGKVGIKFAGFGFFFFLLAARLCATDKRHATEWGMDCCEWETS